MLTPARERSYTVSGTGDNEEEFEWESDDEEATSSTTKTRAEPQPTQPDKPEEGAHAEETPTTKLSTASTPVHASPRHSESEDGSYDVVSSQVSNNGEGKEGDLAASQDTTRPKAGSRDAEEEDSDWE